MLDLGQVKKLSKLSRIKLPENEMESFIAKLQNVMDMINTLQEVETEGVEPLTSAVRAHLYTREDKVTEGGIESQLFANVPGKSAALAKEIKCFIVPKVVE